MSTNIKQILKKSIADWVRQRYAGATVEIPIEVEDFKITEFISYNNVTIPSEDEYADSDLISSEPLPPPFTVVDVGVSMKHNSALSKSIQQNYFKLSYFGVSVEYDSLKSCFHIKDFDKERIKKYDNKYMV